MLSSANELFVSSLGRRIRGVGGRFVVGEGSGLYKLLSHILLRFFLGLLPGLCRLVRCLHQLCMVFLPYSYFLYCSYACLLFVQLFWCCCVFLFVFLTYTMLAGKMIPQCLPWCCLCGCVWLGLVWLGSAWLGLAWLGFAWLDLAGGLGWAGRSCFRLWAC